MTRLAASKLKDSGFDVEFESYFDTVSVVTDDAPSIASNAAAEFGINLRLIDDGRVGFSLDETTTDKDVQELVSVFERCDLVFLVENSDTHLCVRITHDQAPCSMAFSLPIIASTRARTCSFFCSRLARSAVRMSWRCFSDLFSSWS